MLVVEDWHRALTLLENPDNLLVKPPARIVFLPFEIAMVISVFSDQDNTIHRKFLRAERERFTDCVKDRNPFRFTHFPTQSAFLELMDVNGHKRFSPRHPEFGMGLALVSASDWPVNMGDLDAMAG